MYIEKGDIMRVAIFDFDGTLYKQETFQLMMDHLKKHPQYHIYYGQFFRSILPRFIAYKLKLYPESRMKERSMQIYMNALRQLSKQEISNYFAEIAEIMQQGFNEKVVEKFRKHQKDNVYTMLVSGAFTTLLELAVEKYPFDQIIGTVIPFNGQSLTDSKTIYHIQGERKTEKIYQALNDQSIDWENSYAYGDSYSDLPVLQMVGHPIAVQPDKRLYNIAKQNNWQIL